MVDETSGTLLGRRRQGLPLDHFNMNKFWGSEDGNFVTVSRTLQELIENELFKSGSSLDRLVAPRG